MSQKPSSTTVAAPTPSDPRLAPRSLTRWLRGDLGQLPVLVALILIAIYFNVASQGFFLIPRNLSNLALQIATIGTLALASVLVLLLGEIDLSLAAVSGVCGAVLVTLSVYHNWSPLAAILAALVVGAVIGLINGFFVAIMRVPSFIVTLAGLIFYSGVLIRILLPNTTIRLTDEFLTGLAAEYLDPVTGTVIPLVAIGIYALLAIRNRYARARNGLAVDPWSVVIGRVAIAVIAVLLAIFVFSQYLGVPVTTLILMTVIVIFWLLLRFTPFGRHVYAVGGNAEAARRAGISVTSIKLVIFTLAGALAALAGILESSRTISASPQVDPTLLLDAIAAAVIGGVSLFGGRGSVWAVVIGSLVIGSLANGLTLLSQGSDVKQMVEGGVLLIAVTADALIRRRSAVTGR